MTTPIQLNFGNLPLVEAVVRATFAKPIKLTFSKINAVHAELKDSFPVLTEPQHHDAAPGVTEKVGFGPGHITGVVFDAHKDGLAATFQSHVAVLRWVRQFTSDPSKYPRFAAMRDAIWQVTEAVKAAYELDSLPITVVNMSYVNFIPVTDFSKVLVHYFSPLVHVRATENAEEIRKVELSWRENGIDLRFRLEKISATLGDNTTDGCRLTTVAGIYVPEPNGDAKEKLEDAHARLQVFFRDVISDRAKKEWQLKGEPND